MISLRLPKELEEKLNQLSSVEKKTKTDIIRESLQLYIESRENRESAYELASKYFGQSTGSQNQGAIDHHEQVKRKIKQKYNG